MANKRKAFVKPKTVDEVKYTSISKHNAERASEYIFFDPKNITSFECKQGFVGEKPIYIRETLACMWGNEDIEEYVVIDGSAKDLFDSARPKDGSIIKAKVGDIVIDYTHTEGRFSRRHYNVWFERAGVYYYLYIRTSDGRKFKSLMEDFIENPKY